jgi:hypothetical protein
VLATATMEMELAAATMEMELAAATMAVKRIYSRLPVLLP